MKTLPSTEVIIPQRDYYVVKYSDKLTIWAQWGIIIMLILLVFSILPDYSASLSSISSSDLKDTGSSNPPEVTPSTPVANQQVAEQRLTFVPHEPPSVPIPHPYSNAVVTDSGKVLDRTTAYKYKMATEGITYKQNRIKTLTQSIRRLQEDINRETGDLEVQKIVVDKLLEKFNRDELEKAIDSYDY